MTGKPVEPKDQLEEGDYPFIDRSYPLQALCLQPVPAELEELIRDELAARRASIPYDQITELRLESEDYPTAAFMLLHSSMDDSWMVLAPLEYAAGRA